MRSYEEAVEYFESELLPEIGAQRGRVARWRDERAAQGLPFSTKLAIVIGAMLVDGALGGVGLTWIGIAAAFGVDIWRRLHGPEVPAYHVKQELLGKTVEFLEPALSYEARGRVPETILQESGLWEARYDHYHGEDRIHGKLGATEFDLCEIRLEQHYGRKVKKVFEGLLFSADFNKEFRSRTWLLPDASEKHLGVFGRALQNALGGRGQLVQLENPDFERFFRVYSTDPNEARYLLSPSLMRRLRELRENVRAPMRVSLVGGRITLLIEHSETLFRGASVDDIDVDVFRRWLGEIFYTTGLVDELDLNTRIWSKGPPRERPTADGTPERPKINEAAYTHLREDPKPRPRRRRFGVFLESAIAGHVPLLKVFLVFGTLGGFAVSAVSNALLAMGADPLFVAGVSFACSLPIYGIIWRNAGNTAWPAWTGLIRMWLLTGFLSIFVTAAMLATTIDSVSRAGEPASTLPPRTR